MTCYLAVALTAFCMVAQTVEMSAPASEYLTKALDLIQKNALNRERVDWDSVRARAFREAGSAQAPSDTYNAIRSALAALGDHHSSFRMPEFAATMDQRAAAVSPPPSGSLVDDRLARVVVPQFLHSDRSVITEFANTLQNIVRTLDAPSTCGWIVDLRQNGGGNMWPMLAGIGPLLSGSVLGSFVAGSESGPAWSYENGAASIGKNVMVRVTDVAYRLRTATPPIAVLTGKFTASSGEAIAIAFRGNPNTRTFGQRTRGLSTANATFPLSDNALIVLTMAVDADRNGQLYEDGVTPDVLTDETEDGVPMAARRWLLDQPACRQ